MVVGGHSSFLWEALLYSSLKGSVLWVLESCPDYFLNCDCLVLREEGLVLVDVVNVAGTDGGFQFGV